MTHIVLVSLVIISKNKYMIQYAYRIFLLLPYEPNTGEKDQDSCLTIFASSRLS